jgi:hypothetical protein
MSTRGPSWAKSPKSCKPAGAKDCKFCVSTSQAILQSGCDLRLSVEGPAKGAFEVDERIANEHFAEYQCVSMPKRFHSRMQKREGWGW